MRLGKSEFCAWKDKLINAMAQMLGLQWRVFMRNLGLELDRNRKVLSTEQLNRIDGAANLGDAAYVNENLYYVLVEKSEGEAALRVNSGEPGQGLLAYQRIYLGFAGTTGVALSQRLTNLMNPAPPNNEHEIAEAIEKWSDSESILRAHGEAYHLKAACLITALRAIRSCKREQVEFLEREAKAKHGEDETDELFEYLLNRVKEWVHQRLLEELISKSRGDPMDIGLAFSAWHHGDESYAAALMSTQWESVDFQVDALGNCKGKSKGKGPITCFNCGQPSHYAANCPNPYSAKGKGKLQLRPLPQCWTCGAKGHIHSRCPYPPSPPTECPAANRAAAIISAMGLFTWQR